MRVWRLVLGVLLFHTPAATAGGAETWWVMRHADDPGLLAVIVHPAAPNVVYMTWDTVVSFDGGESWEDLVTPREHVGSGSRKVFSAREFSPDPSDPWTVYWITWGAPEDSSRHLVRVTWKDGPQQEILGDLSTFDGGVPSSVLVHPLRPEVLYVGTAKGQLFRSDDRGATWRRRYSPDLDPLPPFYEPGISLIVVPPAVPSTIYINDPVDHTGLYRSFDEGQSWESLDPDPEQRYMATLVASSQNPQLLYLVAAGCGGPEGCPEGTVYRSQDQGTTWESLLQSRWPREIANRSSYRLLAVDPEDPDRVAVAAREGVYLTEDGGKTWRFLELPISSMRGEYEAYSVAIQPTHPKRLLATVVDGLFALELPVGPSAVSPSTWGRIKAPLLPVLPPTSK